MKKRLSTLLAVFLCVVMLAVCMPASAFAEETGKTYTLSFKRNDAAGFDDIKIAPGESFVVPELPDGCDYWLAESYHLLPGQAVSYLAISGWFIGDWSSFDGVALYPVADEGVTVNYYDLNDVLVKSDFVTYAAGNESELPTEIEGRQVTGWYPVKTWGDMFDPKEQVYSVPMSFSADSIYYAQSWHDVHPYDFYPIYADGNQVPTLTEENPSDIPDDEPNDTPNDTPADVPTDEPTDDTPAEKPADVPAVEPAPTEQPSFVADDSDDSAIFVDTRTAQQKEIDEAKANGTWGIEYTTCLKCGYHNWTRKGNVYVCDTCGNETTTVVGPKGVKGYVGSGAIAAMAPVKSAASESTYATKKEAQAAADKREAAYAAAVEAFQKQIAAQNAAYLAALGK